MTIYIVHTDYFDSGVFGCYRSLLGAHKAITKFIDTPGSNLTLKGNYDYTYYVSDGYSEYYFEIVSYVLED